MQKQKYFGKLFEKWGRGQYWYWDPGVAPSPLRHHPSLAVNFSRICKDRLAEWWPWIFQFSILQITENFGNNILIGIYFLKKYLESIFETYQLIFQFDGGHGYFNSRFPRCEKFGVKEDRSGKLAAAPTRKAWYEKYEKWEVWKVRSMKSMKSMKSEK